MNWTEAAGFVAGALCVWLIGRQHTANWPLGMSANCLFAVLFSRAGLYADAGLQLVFTALAGYGWWTWTHGGGPGPRLPVRRTRRSEWLLLCGAGAVGTAAVTVLLHRATDSTVPFWDASTAVLSLLATYGQCRKLVESWWLWLAADVVHVPVYASKGLWLTALLYGVLAGLCVAGLREWCRDLRGRERMFRTETETEAGAKW
ncbi:nicotinamide riboside transporter PnuC [Streptomyces sp. NPDC088745]|uniref:nicotinamide riboside transporter PnuC n=1 Tax=Streptomyces sp. NPDC088745 TaxID=3365884 RepID=UPI00382D8D12